MPELESFIGDENVMAPLTLEHVSVSPALALLSTAKVSDATGVTGPVDAAASARSHDEHVRASRPAGSRSDRSCREGEPGGRHDTTAVNGNGHLGRRVTSRRISSCCQALDEEIAVVSCKSGTLNQGLLVVNEIRVR